VTSLPRFAEDVRHRRLDPAGDVYVVGDVHGCRRTLSRLLDRLDPAPSDAVVFVGDLVRKGPDSAGVLELVRTRANCYSVRGNNEQKLIDGSKSVAGLEAADHEWLAALPHAVSWGENLAVHGGLAPAGGPQDASTLLSMRSPAGGGYDGPFWFERYEGPPRVFFGHTVLERPVRRRWAVGLDTGCVYGGSLTAYDCTRERFVAVQSSEPHQSRPDRKFVTTDADRTAETGTDADTGDDGVTGPGAGGSAAATDGPGGGGGDT
jgi:diadenosine tetraphosphatase ApaH/serine/threonine PP2A family protein phosphatase